MVTTSQLKPYQVILALLIVMICLVLQGLFAWSFFATVTDRPGLNGNAHLYFGLSSYQYSFYTGFVTGLSFLFMVQILKNTFKERSRLLNKNFIYFLVFSLLVLIIEFYLQQKFVSKG